MSDENLLPRWSVNHPRTTLGLPVVLAVIVLLLAALPSIWPDIFSRLNGLKVDTDPENMLAADEPVRVLHRERKDTFALYDTVLLGVVNDRHPAGVFNVATLERVYAITRFAADIDGVIANQIGSPVTLDNIEQAGLGAVSFDWIMPEPPATEEEALAVRDRLLRLPMLRGSIISDDGQALVLQIPIQSKDMSHRVATELRRHLATLGSDGEEWHITGLPVANDTFGVEMFVQMAVSAPMAMVLIFVLMWLFFRRLSLIISPMVVAMLSVIITMGLLIISGQTVHIMSSMIPIFIMPIAVLDSVHILSEFYDRYPETRDRRKTIVSVMRTLWRPMLFTSLTTTVGFASLALAPIPPVQVFGLFVALGVLLAWLLSVTLIPAYIMVFLRDEKLQGFGLANAHGSEGQGGMLPRIGLLTVRLRFAIIAIAVLLAVFSARGINRIVINDNPVKWFEPGHPIRVADDVLNARFAGTYPAYLSLRATGEEPFMDPEVLAWVEGFQRHLDATGKVGKSIALTDLVKTVHRELLEGEESAFRIPDSRRAVAQVLLTFESSQRPEDLFHLVTPDFQEAAIWFQLTSGDNRDMSAVVAIAQEYIDSNRPPWLQDADWFGLTYINVAWQGRMVAGMGNALLSSFVVVFVLMAVLFRSLLWGLLAMIPLTATIGLIYGIIGAVGKSYDMPVAVLSSLSLGLAVDYAIHFLARSREIVGRRGSWSAALPEIYGEPARAISRNIVVVGVGFLPLLLAPLVPYQTVGLLISSILVVAGVSTLLLLPALLSVLQKRAFPGHLSR